ncbi:hypothetical protein OROMI_001612 [Orobanche minor]
MDLPEDLLFNHILCRLPVKSILCFKSVCKTWNRMLREHQFVKHHLNIHQEQACNDNKLLIRSQLTDFSPSFGPTQSMYYSIDSETRVAAFPPEIPGIVVTGSTHLLGSCNGLVAIVVNNFVAVSTIVLWNPSTAESKYIIYPDHTVGLTDLFAFLYDPITDDYKIICIVIHVHYPSYIDMYSCRNNSWKKLRAFPFNWDLSAIDFAQLAGVEFNGYIYWMVKLLRRGQFCPFVIGFGLRDENLIYLRLPSDVICETYNGIYYKASYVGLKAMGTSCIAAFRFYLNDKFIVWTSKDPEKQENKWEKLITLSLSSPQLQFTCSIRPLCFTKDGKILLIIGFRGGDKYQHQHNFGVFDPQNKSLELVQINGMENTTCVMLTTEMEYISSLVSPNMFKSGGMRQVIDTNMGQDIGSKKRKQAGP